VLRVEAWTTIRYLHAQGRPIRAICRELGVSRKAVRQALRREGPPKYARPPRPNLKLAPFEAQIRTWYFGEQLIGSRIIRELRARGYDGHRSAVYHLLEKLRAEVPSAKTTERFETPPGQQAQFDWSPYTVELGGQLVRVIVFGLVLGYSRRKHYTASLDETQASIFEAIESSLRHFGGAPKQLLVDNAKAFVVDPNPAHFRWNPQFLELCGHYRLQPRACQPYRARTKGKIERPFFYLEQHFIKGARFVSFQQFLEQLARFEHDDLDVQVHATTQQRPIDRFAHERPYLQALPEQRFVGTLATSRKVSWDCLVSYGGSRYSVPATYAGKLVWLLPSRGTHVQVLDAKRQLLVEHQLSPSKGTIVLRPEHYAPLRRGTPRTYVVLAEQFLRQFPQQAAFLESLVAQHKLDPTRHLRGIMDLVSLYDAPSVERALGVAQTYNTYSHAFVRGVLEHGAVPALDGAELGARGEHPLPVASVQTDLGRYQRVLEGAQAMLGHRLGALEVAR
jgi:transposase